MKTEFNCIVDTMVNETFINNKHVYFPINPEQLIRCHVDLESNTAELQYLIFDYYGTMEDPDDMTTWGTDPDGYDFSWRTFTKALPPEEQNKLIQIAKALVKEAR